MDGGDIHAKRKRKADEADSLEGPSPKRARHNDAKPAVTEAGALLLALKDQFAGARFLGDDERSTALVAIARALESFTAAAGADLDAEVAQTAGTFCKHTLDAHTRDEPLAVTGAVESGERDKKSVLVPHPRALAACRSDSSVAPMDTSD